MAKNANQVDRKTFAFRLILCVVCFSYWEFINKKALASGTSYDEQLSIMPLIENCSTLEPIETYSWINGETVGILYATECKGSHLPSPLTELVQYRFIDTGGRKSERCYGIVNTSTPSGIEYSWKFLGAVPGNTCSKVNQRINLLFPKGY